MHTLETPRTLSIKGLLPGALLMLVVAVTGSVTESQVAASPFRASAAVSSPLRRDRRNGTKTILAPVAPKQKPVLPVLAQKDILPVHQRIADDVLKLFPYACRQTLENFYVRYDTSMGRRGYAGKSTIMLDGRVPPKEYAQLVGHEMGHVTDLGCLTGNPKSGPSWFMDGDEMIYFDDPSVDFYKISWIDATTKKPWVSKEGFLSEYGMSDAFEDISEAITYALFHIDAFEARAKESPVIAAKLKWIRTHVIQKGVYVARGTPWGGDIPWDITKLDYDAKGLLAKTTDSL